MLKKTNHKYYKEDIKTLIEQTCGKFSNTIAFRFLKDDGSIISWSFIETLEEIKKIENFYKQMKYKEHDKVAVIMPSNTYTAFTVLGLAYAGAVIVPIDISLPIDEIERLLTDTDVAGVVLSDNVLENMSFDIKEKYPFLVIDKNYTFSIADTKKRTARECDIYDNDPENIAIIFSSGTTSKMKGVCISYRSVIESPPKFEELIPVKFGEQKSIFMVYPINHISGFSSMTSYFFYGFNTGMIETITPSNLMAGMQVFKPHYFGFIPKFFEIISAQIDEKLKQAGNLPYVFFRSMMNLNGFLRKHFHINIGTTVFKKINHSVFGENMICLCSGGATCKSETEEYFWKLGYMWCNFYCSTESGVPCISSSYKDKYPIGIVGNVDRFDDTTIKVVSKDINGIGEICIKSGCMMMGYFREPELTKKAFDEDGFIFTGDLGYIDANNYLHLTGRKKEVILMRNGKKASPEDLEKLYADKIGNIPIAVCGIPGRDGYDEIHLFVQSDNKDIKDFIEDKLSIIKGIYKVSEIHITKNLPITKTGKVKRNVLIQSLLEMKNNINSQNENTYDNDFSGIEEILSSIINKDTSCFNDNQLLEDIGFDSLSIIELVIKVEQKYNINISNQLVKIQTIGDLKRTVKFSSNGDKLDETKEREHFPAYRSEKQIKRLKKVLSKIPKIYDISVFNAERINIDKQCIICLNHQSNFDSIPVLNLLSSMGADLSKISFVVGHHLMSNKFTKRMVYSLGCIPIDRFVNTAPAYEDMNTWLKNGGTLMLHPEGYLSVDCSILPFKEGAANIAIENNVPILPIRIDGTHDVLPKGELKPNRKKNGKKIKINIAIGDYIEPTGYDVTSLTEATRNQMLSLDFGDKI